MIKISVLRMIETMTIKTRNWIFIIGIIWMSILMVSLGWFLVQWLLSLPEIELETILRLAGTEQLITAKGLVFSLMGIIIAIFVFYFFRRTASAEVFFFFLYILSFPLEGILSWIYQLHYFQLPLYFITLGYRVFFFFQFMGIFSLFTAGLFSSGMEYTKLEISLGISLLAAFTLAAFMPVDSSVNAGELHYFEEAFYLMMGIKLLAIFNQFLASYKQNAVEFIACGIAIILLIAAREIRYSLQSLYWFAATVLCYTGGTWLFLTRIHKLYQWR